MLGDIAIDVGAERLPDTFALGETGGHLVERLRELAGLVGRCDGHPSTKLAAADPPRAVPQVSHRGRHGIGDEGDQPDGDRERDDRGAENPQHEISQRRVPCKDAGQDGAHREVHHGERNQKPPAERHARNLEMDILRKVFGDRLERRAEHRLEDEQTQHRPKRVLDDRAEKDHQAAPERGQIELGRGVEIEAERRGRHHQVRRGVA